MPCLVVQAEAVAVIAAVTSLGNVELVSLQRGALMPLQGTICVSLGTPCLCHGLHDPHRLTSIDNGQENQSSCAPCWVSKPFQKLLKGIICISQNFADDSGHVAWPNALHAASLSACWKVSHLRLPSCLGNSLVVRERQRPVLSADV